MSRDDSALYTGMSSASFTSPKAQEVKEKRADKRQTRLDTSHKLKPAAEPVLALIEKHKKEMTHVAMVTTSDTMTDAEAGELLRSQRRVYQFLLQFEHEIKIALKESL